MDKIRFFIIALVIGVILGTPGHGYAQYAQYAVQSGIATPVGDGSKFNGITSAPQPVTIAGSSAASGYDSGPVTATATPANSSHAAGTSVGGLFSLAMARTAGGSGIVSNFAFKSTGGSTGSYAVRIWDKSPGSTTCTDNVAFVGSETDDANLITPPFTIVPTAPGSTTGDAYTYAAVTSVSLDYKNADTSPGMNLYACLVTVATDTADENKLVRVMMSGPQN